MDHKQFIVPPGKQVRLKDYDPAFTGDFKSEREAEDKIQADRASLAEEQDILLAHETYALLLIFQAMDGAGKDGTIKYVMSSVDPQGCTVAMFQKPSGVELKHDYLWRFVQRLPERGRIGIFNRSHYEEVLVTRVHPDQLDEQNLPDLDRGAAEGKLWRQRFAQINNFEQYLVENGIIVLKFFLHLSKEKQRERLLERITLPEKQWKFSSSDIEERDYWDDYMRAYEDAISSTSTERAPWHIIPADHRWFSALTVADIVVARLKALNLSYPEPNDEQREAIERARESLEGE